ncbi:tyrosine-protein kinase family protein [Dankookia rubra]|uniref:Tyrosine-protein kinase family protein n=1 Tax=Dankookia rubra TaxID=1442381 RepID=A0A4R5Q741_9PROT|nr:tyrosine-protein kinase family protein [Dankookia rubra]TDH58071.1 tyrosine-protein kinase family protein [Dankookia rubra]
MPKDLAPEALSEEIETVWRGLVASGLHCVAVTAANNGEGTSTIAAALARRAEHAGKTVLLAEIFADKPTLAARCGMHLPPGEPVRIGAEGLSVMALPANAPANWQQRDFFAWRMAAWQRDYDLVVLDLAPVLASPGEGMGSLSVAAAAACTLLVVLAGKTKAEAVRKAQDRLGRAGANLLGIVLNDKENPSLKEELEREVSRIAGFLPGLARRLRSRVRRLPVLGVQI